MSSNGFNYKIEVLEFAETLRYTLHKRTVGMLNGGNQI